MTSSSLVRPVRRSPAELLQGLVDARAGLVVIGEDGADRGDDEVVGDGGDARTQAAVGGARAFGGGR